MTISPLEAENAVIGSILIDPSCLRAVSGVLRGGGLRAGGQPPAL